MTALMNGCAKRRKFDGRNHIIFAAVNHQLRANVHVATLRAVLSASSSHVAAMTWLFTVAI